MQRKGWRGHPWIRFVAVALSYGLALMLFRQLSIPHWIVLTGFHLAVLMLADYSDWPALFVGESARLLYVSLTCYDQFGVAWAIVNVIPSIAIEGPIVWWFRQRFQLFSRQAEVNVPALVLCSLMTAAVATVITLGQLQLTPLPPGYVLHYGEVSARLVLGNFVGVLTVAPLVLAVRQSFIEARRDLTHWWHNALESRLLLECVFAAAPVIAFLAWAGTTDRHAQALAQMAMFLPVVLLAMRHGWQGAAAGGTLASLGVVLLMPERNDHATLQAETLVAMVIATMLLVGGRVAGLNSRAQQDRFDMHQALALAQRSVWLGEAQLRSNAATAEHLQQSVQAMFQLMLGRLKHLQPGIDDSGYRRQAQNTQDQLLCLADSLHPSGLHERGLEGALMDGVLSRTLRDAGLSYRCDLRGPLSVMPQPILLAAYRIVAEAIVATCSHRDASSIVVKIRCGSRDRLWMVVGIEIQARAVSSQHVDWQMMSERLRAFGTGLGHKAIEDRAAAFQGEVRERELPHGRRLIVSLRQPQDPSLH